MSNVTRTDENGEFRIVLPDYHSRGVVEIPTIVGEPFKTGWSLNDVKFCGLGPSYPVVKCSTEDDGIEGQTIFVIPTITLSAQKINLIDFEYGGKTTCIKIDGRWVVPGGVCHSR